jgi:hypothetical protein
MTELSSPKTRSLSQPLAEWAQKRIRLDGVPFSFEGHGYLKAIYDDPAQHIVLSKAAQVGGTTWALLRSVHACLSGLNVVYFFPTHTDVIDFSKSRVTPLLRENPFLMRMVKDTDAAGLKRIGDANLYFRGMQSNVGMKSVPADMIVFDELDEAEPNAKAMAKERLSHSSYKRIIELSNPSLPDYGIDEQYQRSDQRHWTIKCGRCGEWTCLEKAFPEKMGQEVRIILPRPDGTFYRACVRCGAELDLDQGEWVADYPSREIHGYRISQLFSSTVDPGEILKEYRMTRYADRFYNLKIGVPWADLERRLDVGSVLSLRGNVTIPREWNYCYMGVDTGRALHVVILRQPNEWREKDLDLVHLGVYRDFEDLDELMRKFNVYSCVIDGLPETHATREFAKRHWYSVFLCFFNENQRDEARWDSSAHTVTVNRTEALDTSRRAIRERIVTLPQQDPLLDEFAKHMTVDAKILDEDEETGAKRYRYIKAGGENHFSLAFTYAFMAAEHSRMNRPTVVWA